MQEKELNTTAKSLLEDLKLGTMQSHANMVVFPLFLDRTARTRYTTLTEALGSGTLAITEVDEGGSVPELAVVNNGDLPVLLLDGEELIGAKQNRVLNTTILVKKQTKTIIPVSCTEQGRWSYSSARFEDSGVIMHRSARARKNRSVSFSLSERDAYDSDQGEVWESIEELQNGAAARSSTSAMRDVFTQREQSIEAYLAAFPVVDGQRGLLVCVDGQAVGFDYLSADSAYTILHPKLVRSYAMDAMIASRPEKKKRNDPTPPQLGQSAGEMLKRATQVREHRHKSIGHGWDHRFAGDQLIGSSLQYRNQVLHMAFFADDGQEPSQGERYASLSRRRHYRKVD